MKKFMVAFREDVYEEMSLFCELFRISIQELFRARIVPEWLKANRGVLAVHVEKQKSD